MKNFKEVALTRFEWDGVYRTLGEVWVLEKAERRLICRLVNHPLGWELRLFVGNDLFRSETCRIEAKVFEVADQWETEALAKGWQRT